MYNVFALFSCLKAGPILQTRVFRNRRVWFFKKEHHFNFSLTYKEANYNLENPVDKYSFMNDINIYKDVLSKRLNYG